MNTKFSLSLVRSSSSSTYTVSPAMPLPIKKPKKPSVTVLRQLPRELARLAPLYESRRDAHPALTPYRTLDSLVATLTHYTPESKSDRIALISALIDVHRESRHPVWTTVLLRVFRPMLNRIREKLVGAPADELDAALLSSFLEALLVVDTKGDPALIPKLVRWRTRRLLFRTLGEEAQWEAVGFGVDCETEPDPATEGDTFLVAVWLRKEQGDAESVELVRTLFEHGALWTLVRRRYADRSTKEQMRAYHRLQGKRRRMIQRLRHRLRHEVREQRRTQRRAAAPPKSVVARRSEAAAAALSESPSATADVVLNLGEKP
jgi:hypothetical protein